MSNRWALERLGFLHALTQSETALSESAKGRVLRLVELVANALQRLPALVDQDREEFAAEVSALQVALDELPRLIVSGDEKGAYQWGRRLVSLIEHQILERRVKLLRHDGFTSKDEAASVIDEVLHNLAVEDERLSILEDEERFRAHAAELAEDAERSAFLLQQAAGIGGSATLSSHFATYANRELWSANLFRILAILAIICALGAAALLPHPQVGDWVNFSYRVAQLVGIAALAAYLARQATGHRRVSNWAMSMKVQLQSFPAFIEPVEDGPTRSAIYDAFAKRVLGPPPEKGAASTDGDTFPSPQLLELLLTVAKKA
jgi:hypothetical protein